MRTVAVTLFLIGLPSHAHAHGTESHGATASWTYDPWVVIPLLIAGILYALGSSVLARRSVVGRKVRGWHSVAYIAGWLSLTLALVSPLHWLGEHLFTFHMIEHEIVMAISAPLLVISRPVGTFLWSLPRRHRVAVGRLLRRRVVTATWRWVSSGAKCDIASRRRDLGLACAVTVRCCRRQCHRTSAAASQFFTNRHIVLVVCPEKQRKRCRRVASLHHDATYQCPRCPDGACTTRALRGSDRYRAGLGFDTARRPAACRAYHVGARRDDLRRCDACFHRDMGQAFQHLSGERRCDLVYIDIGGRCFARPFW